MERGERFYRIHRVLKAGKCLPVADFMADLSVSLATFKRDIEYLRDRYGAPIAWDRERRGYYYDMEQEGAGKFDLPGLWFSASEVHALLVMHTMLGELGSGLLAGQTAPLIARLERLLEERHFSASEVRRRIRVANVAARVSQPEHFGICAQALLQRRRLTIVHYHRQRDEVNRREVSPQRLIDYRGTWYLDAWCHWRQGLRSFSLDALKGADLGEEAAVEVPDADLDAYLATSYGIFAGEPTATAVLRFSPTRSRWVQREVWHPKQKGEFDDQGRYVLEIPYNQDQELIMDVLRHGSDVEVVGPEALRRRISEELSRARDRYP
jgi:predicted DNA-binding transcriptional regulator YafY